MAQTLVLGVRHQTGIGKESGKAYDMRPSLVIGSPLETVDRETLKINAAGYESMAVECSPEAYRQVAQFQAKNFPMILDLDMSSRKRGDVAFTYIEGVRAKSAA